MQVLCHRIVNKLICSFIVFIYVAVKIFSLHYSDSMVAIEITARRQSVLNILTSEIVDMLQFVTHLHIHSFSSLPQYCHHVDHYGYRLFCGVHSSEGTLFACASQDQNIHLFDTSNGKYQVVKSLVAPEVGWSVLDVCFR